MAYILQVTGGQYDEEYTSNVVVSRDLTKIEERKANLEHKRDLLVDIYNKTATYSREYYVENPFDHSAQEHGLPIPKWTAGIAQHLITPEMRAERDAIIETNAEIHKRNSTRSMEWINKYKEAELEFAQEFGLFDLIDKSELDYNHSVTATLFKYTDMRYQIKEIEEI